MGTIGTSTVVPAIPSWRLQDERYQRKTAGGVYFYSSPAGWGLDIDPALYKALPTYAQKAVLALDASRTADGVHYSIYYVDKQGTVQYFDEYGRSDFMWGVRHAKDEMGDMNNWQDDWNKIGDQLRRK